MRMPGFSSPFGTPLRTHILLALARDGESWGRKLANQLGTHVFGVQKALEGLELDALVCGRDVGRTRLFTLNPTYFAIAELRAYLARLLEGQAV